jgi:hypothetical protein
MEAGPSLGAPSTFGPMSPAAAWILEASAVATKVCRQRRRGVELDDLDPALTWAKLSFVPQSVIFGPGRCRCRLAQQRTPGSALT